MSDLFRSVLILMKLIPPSLFLAAAALMTGCCSVKTYLTDRGHDALDVVTVTVGVGAGVAARFGPLHTGALFTSDVLGLRAGAGFYDPGNIGRPIDVDTNYAVQLELPFPIRSALMGWGSSMDSFNRHGLSLRRGKCYEASNFYCWIPARYGSDPWSFVPFLTLPKGITQVVSTEERVPWWYFTEIEAVGGLGLTLRMGVNPGEFVDFLLGWLGIDIFNDDDRLKNRRTAPNQAVHPSRVHSG